MATRTLKYFQNSTFIFGKIKHILWIFVYTHFRYTIQVHLKRKRNPGRYVITSFSGRDSCNPSLLPFSRNAFTLQASSEGLQWLPTFSNALVGTHKLSFVYENNNYLLIFLQKRESAISRGTIFASFKVRMGINVATTFIHSKERCTLFPDVYNLLRMPELMYILDDLNVSHTSLGHSKTNIIGRNII